MNKVEISLKEANEKLREMGLKPFPIDALTIDPRDSEHLRLSVENIRKQFEEWVWKQQLK